MSLASAALRRPVTVLVAIVAVTMGAWQALTQMPQDIRPTLGIPTIYVALAIATTEESAKAPSGK